MKSWARTIGDKESTPDLPGMVSDPDPSQSRHRTQDSTETNLTSDTPQISNTHRQVLQCNDLFLDPAEPRTTEERLEAFRVPGPTTKLVMEPKNNLAACFPKPQEPSLFPHFPTHSESASDRTRVSLPESPRRRAALTISNESMS